MRERNGVMTKKEIEQRTAETANPVEDGRLTIRAERHQSASVSNETSTRSEVRYGSYRRSLDLPPGATAEDTEATYENGILDVRIPTPRPRPEPQRIQIPVN